MEETISLKELFLTLKKRLLLILLIAAIATSTSGVVSYFLLTPVYESSTQLLVNQAKTDQQVYSPNEVQTNLQLINTYNVIIKSPAILEKVIAQETLPMTAEELNEIVTVSSEENSQVVNIAVQHEDPQQAAAIANSIAAIFKTEITKIMNVDNVSILTQAQLGEDLSPVKPKPILNMAIALVVGVMLGVGLAFFLEYLDNTIKSEQDIEKQLGLPVLGAVTVINTDGESAKMVSQSAVIRTRGESVGS
ncbi:Wzz/FepE/Etk N-terminal domain-containing protein [uncultured Metabacillus sp.]|uniref:YveK family protein n=1 Tax=uncultured Metabacillus sp. TaxID=2860135 RepID=UPI00260B8986|nr:Wzz/FepE/Etk N-terminal domain-containing protein [uncultured Metabacillus sp.]